MLACKRTDVEKYMQKLTWKTLHFPYVCLKLYIVQMFVLEPNSLLFLNQIISGAVAPFGSLQGAFGLPSDPFGQN